MNVYFSGTIYQGKPARRIEVLDKPKRRIDPKEFAEAIGAEFVGENNKSPMPNLAMLQAIRNFT